ncbi:hypothetical protein CHARACLAT_032356, partial [Characodon lateralis]|nr:hypothetical protein [Characodon lateralis]
MISYAARGAHVQLRIVSQSASTYGYKCILGFPLNFVNWVLISSCFGFYLSVPDTAPTDVGGGGGTKSELVITWEPLSEELQNGEGFGYIIAFRSVGMVKWTRAIISTPGVSRYVLRNDTIRPFSPFDVKVAAFNNRGEGPFSSITTVYSAEDVPSVAPKMVRARSLSAAEIEVIWEILPSLPERVLGYE